MPLVIEDGSIVSGANSFTTDAEFIAYCDARNITFPCSEAERDSLQIKAMDYLFSKEDCMKGSRTSSTQNLPYPRNGVYIRCVLNGSAVIPQELKTSQMALAAAAITQVLLVNGGSQNVAKEQLGSMLVEYFNGGSWERVRLDSVNAFLSPLLKDNSGQLVRV